MVSQNIIKFSDKRVLCSVRRNSSGGRRRSSVTRKIEEAKARQLQSVSEEAPVFKENEEKEALLSSATTEGKESKYIFSHCVILFSR